MSAFWVIAGLMVLVVLACALAPVMIRPSAQSVVSARRSENIAAYQQQLAELDAQGLPETEYARARVELDRMLLADAEDDTLSPADSRNRGAGLLLGSSVVIMVLAAVLYQQLGAGEAIHIDQQLALLSQSDDEQDRLQRALELLPALERAAEQDESGEYLFLLARFSMSVQRYPEAAAAYSRLATLYPDDAAILAQYAQALYVAGGNTMTPEVKALVERASVIDPSQVTLLGMLGMDQFQQGDFAAAIGSWSKLLTQLDPASQDAQIIRDGIAMARQNIGEDTDMAALQATEAPAAPGSEAVGPGFEVTVRLADGLEVPPDATVFVFARAVSGPPMPLAVQRFSVADLPQTVLLSDAQSMMPQMTISRFEEVSLTARVSISGQPAAQPGDFEGGGETFTVEKGVQRLEIVIDRPI